MSVENGSFEGQKQIPSQITLGGVTYNVKDYPELQNLISTASSAEKAKLYSTFEALKKQIASLQNVQVINPINKEELDAKYLTAESASKLISESINNALKPLIEANNRNAIKDLNAYREKLIKENEDKCIPELVKGNSEEELNSALQESIRIRSLYTPKPLAPVVDPVLQSSAKQLEQSAAQPAVQTPPQQMPQQRVAVPNVPQTEMPNAFNQPDVKTMSMEEYARNRDSLMSQLQSLYGVN